MNHVVLIGNLVKDGETAKTQNGISVSQFNLAVNKGYSNSDEKPDYFNIVAWRGSADYIGMYGKKGDTVAVRGRLSTRSYEAKDGTKRYITEVVAEEVKIVRHKNEQKQDPSFDEIANSEAVNIGSDDLPF